ncbi:ATPase, T2SS/T4P/T4SS family [Paenibacillus mucilaginosus]|uniref:Type II secretion system protein E n=1 Tax=Paenibacillus mucilaginosus (strain KNP414) TaxID=1036673 RepID=F8FP82_PAEMK|nr:ATPase, T2SS/T4P/T4SS family [Paenibacillus mucilaginosus]AEI39032.1 type II secretion system protein E [Paenibacillus mucilaginosus KNP414]MCG7216166.1 Flp pilus assembly complex ATPase component TadA [Paenibacillus mucilaginosus]WDM28070.1 CpaF family protein [Paenibacillus mucilaginosus]
MLTPEKLKQRRARYGRASLYTKEEISFTKIVEQCSRYLHRLNREMNLSALKAKQRTRDNIDRFVNDLEVKVEGYENPDQLRKALKDEMIHYGIISELMEDPAVNEIRINGYDRIFYEAGGMTKRYDKAFSSPEDARRVIERLLGEVRITENEPFKNARTLEEGWRINAIHGEISHLGEYGVVIRKFRENTFRDEDFLENGVMTQDMLNFLQFMPQIYVNWWTVGPTGSGKTALNEAILKKMNPSDRTIIVENPTEIRFEQKDERTGQTLNDFLQLVAKNPDPENEKNPNWPTMNNLLTNALRQTPKYLGVGEIRTPEEFKTMLVAAQTGHQTFATFHADAADKALQRYLTTYLMVSPNEPPELVMSNLCDTIDLIVCVKLFPKTGKRRVTSIAEVIGSEGMKPLINIIYEYEIEHVDDDGVVKSSFVRRNAISDKLIAKFKDAHIPFSRYAKWAQPPAGGREVEATYYEGTQKEAVLL